MARKVRIQFSGAIYHVMNRGNHRERIFVTDADRQLFLGTRGHLAVLLSHLENSRKNAMPMRTAQPDLHCDRSNGLTPLHTAVITHIFCTAAYGRSRPAGENPGGVTYL